MPGLRNLEIQLEKARAEAQENKTAQGRVRVLTRLRDRIRRNVGRFHEITNDEIIRSGLYTLLDSFEKIHGASNGGFSAKEFRDNLSKTLDWYTEENLSEHYEGLIYNDAVRAALEDVYNTLGVAVETKNGEVRKNLTSDAMQKSSIGKRYKIERGLICNIERGTIYNIIRGTIYNIIRGTIYNIERGTIYNIIRGLIYNILRGAIYPQKGSVFQESINQF